MNYKEEFGKINPDRKIPTIDDDGFILTESHAIMTYLLAKYGKEGHLYPSDPKQRALVDSYLHWHHTNIRSIMKLFQYHYPKQLAYKIHHIKEVEEENVRKSLKYIDEYFLKDKKFIHGLEQLSIADISAACEITQLEMIDFDLTEYPNVENWLYNMMKFKEMKEAHEVYDKLVSIARSKKIWSFCN